MFSDANADVISERWSCYRHARTRLQWPAYSCAMCDFCLHINPVVMIPWFLKHLQVYICLFFFLFGLGNNFWLVCLLHIDSSLHVTYMYIIVLGKLCLCYRWFWHDTLTCVHVDLLSNRSSRYCEKSPNVLKALKCSPLASRKLTRRTCYKINWNHVHCIHTVYNLNWFCIQNIITVIPR